MNMRPIALAAFVAVAATTMVGCASQTPFTDDKRSVNATLEEAKKLREQHQQTIKETQQRRVREQDVPLPFVAGNSVPLSRSFNLPEPLKANVPVTAHFSSSPVTLDEALRQLALATGLVLTAAPDALADPSNFAERAKAEGSGPVSAPARVQLTAKAVPIWQVLDELAAQTRTHWRATPTGAEFYRLETKTYALTFIPQVAGTTAALGRNTSASNAFASDSKTTFTIDNLSQVEGVKNAVEAMLSKAGRATMVRESQTLVVTDTPEIQAKVEQYIKAQNAAFSRKVRLVVEAIEVTNRQALDFGVDWSFVYNTTVTALSASGPGSQVNSQAGQIGYTPTTGAMAGSSFVVKALADAGFAVNRRVFPLVTMSGRPITQALRSTFNYVDQVQTTSIASSTNTTTQAPTVTQKDETVGTLLTLVPIAQPDGRIFMSMSFDVTSAEPLRPYTVGSGDTAVTVQQKTINGNGIIQEVALRNGRTELLGGVDLYSANVSDRRLGDEVPVIFGGSLTKTNSKSITLLLVTANVEEGV